MSPKRATLQLRLVQVILRAARGRGTVDREMLERAAAIVEATAGALDPGDGNAAVVPLLDSVRAEIASLGMDAIAIGPSKE